jgi:hypothetical protein
MFPNHVEILEDINLSTYGVLFKPGLFVFILLKQPMFLYITGD